MNDAAPASDPRSPAFFAYLADLAAAPGGDDPARWGERSRMLARWHRDDGRDELAPTGPDAARYVIKQKMRGLAPSELERRVRDAGRDDLADALTAVWDYANPNQPTDVRHACNRIIDALVAS